MTAWRLARSLETLRNEVNQRWPARDKASDGTIGDTAHAATASDHNPNADGVVCAFDITHDPHDPHGPDGSELAERLRLLPHPDVKYVIWDRRMFSAYPRGGVPPFTWRPYTGADPHTNHVHVSVGVGPDGHSQQPYDDTVGWLDASPTPEEDDMSQQQVDEIIKEIRDNAIAVATDVKSTKTDVDTVAKKLDQVNERLDAIEAKLK